MTSNSADRGHKRSWKNLLINKRYQLRFTLFMVVLSSVLMVGLGIWVMRVANETTAVSMTSVRGDACPRLPSFARSAQDGEDEDASSVPPSTPGASPRPTAAAPAPGAGSGSTADEPHHVNVQIDESSMTLTPTPPRTPSVVHWTSPHDLADRIAAHWSCELRQVATFDRLERGRTRILWAMIATGIALVFGLALYGIKMTHRVAGPLFKVSLYLSKMREGRFDKVYNLRKGDQLIEFYDHFKLAHGGIVAMQQDDIARLAAVIATAEAAGLGQHPAVAELRDLARRKEKSIE
ncbi:MAG TPA: hypothetical protein VF469_17060 [Kofleriaceae bacterium]